MLPSLANELAEELDALATQSRLRISPTIAGNSRIHVLVNNQRCISFCSNDYLGLACDPRLKSAALEAANNSGFGASASRLVSGTHPEHIALEAALAQFLKLQATLLFPSGYQANLGVITALAGPNDLIVADRLVHASLLDAFRLSKAKLAVYPHLDALAAKQHLARLAPGKRRRFLVTESLFSMDGDIAPLRELAQIAADHDTILIVDEAHAFGTLGPDGRGLCAAAGIEPDILIATLGKTLGTSGAFVAGTKDLRSILLNHARTFIFTTAIPPPVAAAAQEALRIVSSPEGNALRHKLTTLSLHLHSALTRPVPDAPTPIIPFITGSNEATLQASRELLEEALFVQAIRHPTVREGTARLRITLSSLHSTPHLDALAQVLNQWTHRIGPSTRAQTSSRSRHTIAPGQKPPPPNTMSSGIFLVGTDTGVGKTAIAIALLHLLTKAGYRPVPFKPVESGAAPNPNDAIALLHATERHDIPIECVCPIPLPNPVTPAAHANSQEITLATLTKHAEAIALYGNPIIVESAGGLLSPISKGLTPLDLAAALGLPVLLVSRNALGTINHTTLAITEIFRRHLPFLGTILVTGALKATPDQPHNAKHISDATGMTLLGTMPFLPHPTPASLAKALRQAVDLSRVLPGFSI